MDDSAVETASVAPAAGPEEAAILLMALGEAEAANVLRYMEPAEVQTIGAAMGRIGGVSQQAIGLTLDRFAARIGQESSLGYDTDRYFRDTLTRAIGEGRASNVLGRLVPSAERRTPDSLKWMHPTSIARLMQHEHPQVVATVLGALTRDQAGDVLRRLPEAMHADLLERVSRLDILHPDVVAEIEELLANALVDHTDIELTGFGGVQAAAEILNAVGKSEEERILTAIDAGDEELGQRIRDAMFIFENLLSVDGRGLQMLLREVTSETLVPALKGASAELQTKLFANMSQSAADLLRDDLEASAPVRLSDVELAQRSILDVAKRLEADGKISLGTSGDDLV